MTICPIDDDRCHCPPHLMCKPLDPTNNCPGCGAPENEWCKGTSTDCRSRAGNTGPMQQGAARVPYAPSAEGFEQRAAACKPTNPKDAVGVRKAPMSVVPANVLAELGVAMLEGTAKYGRHNYRAVGVRASVYYDGTMRHLFDWWEGTDTDPDSGVHHVTKAIAGLVVLRDAMMQGKCEDDRPPRSAPFYERLNAAAGAVLDKHADKTPHHYTIADAAE